MYLLVFWPLYYHTILSLLLPDLTPSSLKKTKYLYIFFLIYTIDATDHGILSSEENIQVEEKHHMYKDVLG